MSSQSPGGRGVSPRQGRREPPGNADVIVVGAGHNGLVAACYLAKAGLDVLVVERSATPGGMTCTNPMAPEAPDHLINEASIQASLFRTTPIDDELGLSKKYGLRQRLINPAHVQLNPEGESLAWWRVMDRTVEEIKYFSRKDAARWIELSNTIAAATAIGLPMMMTSPVRPEWPNVMKTLKAAVKGRKELRNILHWATISQKEAIEETFEHDMVRAPLTCNLPFMHFDSDASGWSLIYLGVYQKWGVAMFEGGTGAFPGALIRCLEDHGGRIRCSAPVEKFVMAGDRVAGVRLEGGEEL
ncbi:MAG: phytoene desaturase family protein, partial [Acidimicrobiia bacterium]